MPPTLHLVVPGSIDTLTGGYRYDRQMVDGLVALGWHVRVHELTGTFPTPSPASLQAADRVLSDIPDGARVMIDGLALGAMPALAHRHGARWCLLGLVHHPLAMETGLPIEEAQRLFHSEQEALAACRHVIVPSPDTACALERYAVRPERCTVVRPGTDALAAREASRRAPPFGERGYAPVDGNGLEQVRGGVEPDGVNAKRHPHDMFRLLCVASLTPRKGHDVLIDALASIRDLPWHLDCVGSAELDRRHAAWLEARIRAHNLETRIRLSGEISPAKLWEHYRAADLFVLASRHEGYGMVFDEAIAFELPIVSMHAGAIPQTVPAEAGRLVPVDDVEALATVLASVMCEPARYDSLRRGARNASRQLRDWSTAARELATVLERFDADPDTTRHTQARHPETTGPASHSNAPGPPSE